MQRATTSNAPHAADSDLPPAQRAGNAPIGLEDREAFTALLAEYDRAIARISASHDSLLKKVADLTAEIEHKNRLLARQERLAALGEMAAGVAHEIRNPLGGIALYVDLLRKDVHGNEGSLAICEKIGGAVARLNHIVEAILGFTRPVEPKLQDVNVRALTAEAAEMAKPLATQRKVSIAADVSPALNNLRADPELLHHLVLNLLRNAVEASADGKEVLLRAYTIPCTAEKPGQPLSKAVIEVRDGGPGIAPENRDKIFTPFFTTKKGGTGLGLALCQRIAEAHGGELKAANHPEGGAVFTLVLP
ncbi:MAG: sensor histidine kinase [Planctomycetaceae bacterium]|nr:sensor histidine kinase [Planctomycetaceae bacterium]